MAGTMPHREGLSAAPRLGRRLWRECSREAGAVCALGWRVRLRDAGVCCRACAVYPAGHSWAEASMQ